MTADIEGATRQIARFVSKTRFEDIPREITERTKALVLDALACLFIGHEQRAAQIVLDRIKSTSAKPAASVLGASWRTSMGMAARANGTMIGAFEVEHVGHNAHPSGTCFPAALAAAEVAKADGRALLAALAIGYEVTCRIGAAQTAATEFERGFHNPAVNGPFGAAAAAARLFGLEAHGVSNALGLAGSRAAGLTEYLSAGSMVKRVHLGWAAEAGVDCADLAAHGFTGPWTVLEGTHGFLKAFSPTPQPDRLTDGLGTHWIGTQQLVKTYPCHATLQGLVGAICSAKRQNRIDPDSISRAELVLSGRVARERHWITRPWDLLSAQVSAPFTTAVALRRDLDDPRSYDESALADPAIAVLADRIQRRVVTTDSSEWGMARLRLSSAFGDVELGQEVEPDVGFHRIADKLLRYAGGRLGTHEVHHLTETVSKLERDGALEEMIRVVTPKVEWRSDRRR